MSGARIQLYKLVRGNFVGSHDNVNHPKIPRPAGRSNLELGGGFRPKECIHAFIVVYDEFLQRPHQRHRFVELVIAYKQFSESRREPRPKVLSARPFKP